MVKYLMPLLVILLISNISFGQEKKNSTDAPGPLQKWAELTVNDQTARAYIAFPDSRHENVSIIILHDGDGISGWEKSVADKFALEGYSAIIPDLTMYKSAMAEIEAAHQYIIEHSKEKPEIYLLGFGEGGSKALAYASQNEENVQGVMFFYAAVPEDIRNIKMPVYAFYAGNDRVLGTEMQEDVKRLNMLGNNFQFYIYPEATHNFMILGAMEEAGRDNRKARNEAWQQVYKILGLGS